MTLRVAGATFAATLRIAGWVRCLFSKAITRPFYHDGEARATIRVEMLIQRTTARKRAQRCYNVRRSEWEDVRMAVSMTEILI